MNTKLIIFSLIILSFLIITPVKAEKQRIYLIQVNYDRGQASFGNVSTKLGYAPQPEDPRRMSQHRYWIELVSFSGKVLEKRLFSIPLEIAFEPPEEGEESLETGPVMLEQTEHLVILPYHEDGKRLYLYNVNRNRIDQKDIGYLAQVCGDGKCQDHESYEDCPKDCPAIGKDDYCNKEKAGQDPDCREFLKADSETVLRTNNMKIIIFIVSAIIILSIIIAAYYFLARKPLSGEAAEDKEKSDL